MLFYYLLFAVSISISTQGCPWGPPLIFGTCRTVGWARSLPGVGRPGWLAGHNKLVGVPGAAVILTASQGPKQVPSAPAGVALGDQIAAAGSTVAVEKGAEVRGVAF